MHFTAHHHGTDKLGQNQKLLPFLSYAKMKKQAKKTVRKSTKHKWPETIEHHRFGTLKLLKNQYATQIEWGGRTIVFYVLGLNNELPDENSVHHILDAASILLINEPGWRKRFEALIKQDIDNGSLDHWQLKPRQKSQLCKSFEPSIVSVAWSANYDLQIYFDLEVTDPIVAKAPSASFWTIELDLEPNCRSIDMEIGD